MSDIHYHVVIEYGGIAETTTHPSFTAAVEKARGELLIEKIWDREVPRKLRRIFRRVEFLKGVYAKWTGHPRSGADHDISIEVSACTTGLHPA